MRVVLTTNVVVEKYLRKDGERAETTRLHAKVGAHQRYRAHDNHTDFSLVSSKYGWFFFDGHKDAIECLRKAIKNRTFEQTNLNLHSSRQHLMIKITMINNERSTTLNILDFCGLESLLESGS